MAFQRLCQMSLVIQLLVALVRAAFLPDSMSSFSCPDPLPSTISTFEGSRYLGDWYAQYTIPQSFQPSGSRCIRAQYGDGGEGFVSVYNSGTRPDGTFDEICGRAYQADPDNEPGYLLVEFPVSASAGQYRILDTDYESFVVVYSCVEGGLFGGGESGWIMTREPIPDQAVVDRGIAVLRRHNVSTDAYEYVEHDANCQYDSDKTCKGEEFPSNPVKRVVSVFSGLKRMVGRFLTTGLKI